MEARGEFTRTERMLGADGMERLAKARVAVFGIGGVGGHAAEALVRSGIGALDIIDSEEVDLSNLNRQIIALHSTVGKAKVDAAEKRFLDINPALKLTKHKVLYLPETAGQFDFRQYDYVVDAIDTVSGKIQLVLAAQDAGVPIISSMGAGNKLDPTQFKVADIYATSVCPLARVMRYELKKRGVKRLKVVYSTEPPRSCAESGEAPTASRRSVPASNAFTPSVAGLIIASEVVKDISGVR
ncbi:MAG: ThiF family adenylyltransferase [Oscillospiraceae bacterium]